MGTPEFAVPALNSIIDAGHDVELVVTQPDRRGNRGKVVFSPVKACALNRGIKVSQPNNIKNDPDFIKELDALKPDLIVVAAFGQILPQEIWCPTPHHPYTFSVLSAAILASLPRISSVSMRRI